MFTDHSLHDKPAIAFAHLLDGAHFIILLVRILHILWIVILQLCMLQKKISPSLWLTLFVISFDEQEFSLQCNLILMYTFLI